MGTTIRYGIVATNDCYSCTVYSVSVSSLPPLSDKALFSPQFVCLLHSRITKKSYGCTFMKFEKFIASMCTREELIKFWK